MAYIRTITIPEACDDCAASAGKTELCGRAISGGNKRVFYFANRCDINEIGIEDGTNIITQLEMKTGKGFFQVTSSKNTLTWTEDLTLPNGFLTQTLVFNISQLSNDTDLNQAYQDALDFAQQFISSSSEYIFLIQTRIGVWRLFGLDNGLEISAGSNVSGAAIADVSANTLTFISGESEFAHVVASAVIANLPIL